MKAIALGRSSTIAPPQPKTIRKRRIAIAIADLYFKCDRLILGFGQEGDFRVE